MVRLLALLMLLMPAVAPAQTAAPEQRPLDEMTVNEVIGRPVYGADGAALGRVERVVVGEDRLPQLVLELGGFLGFGTTAVGLPMDELRREGERLVLGRNLSEQALIDRYALNGNPRLLPGNRLLGEAAQGQTGRPDVTELDFARLDRNGDDAISMAEAEGYERLSFNWPDADTNNDGVLSRAEFGAFVERIQERGVQPDSPATGGADPTTGGMNP